MDYLIKKKGRENPSTLQKACHFRWQNDAVLSEQHRLRYFVAPIAALLKATHSGIARFYQPYREARQIS